MLMCHIFPFGEVEKNEEIIIWGMGYVGKQYVEEILYTKYCKVLFAVDQKYNEIHFPYVDIKRPETIKEYPNIKIVIAQQNILIANEIKNKLLKWEIVDKKIVHNSKFITLEDSLSNRINQVCYHTTYGGTNDDESLNSIFPYRLNGCILIIRDASILQSTL